MWETEVHKVGKRKKGFFCKNKKSGIVVYLALKWHKDIFRSGEPTISEAMRKGTASWGIDRETLQLARIRGVKYIGVKEREKGSVYLTSIESFYSLSYLTATKGGNPSNKYVPLSCFKIIEGMNII